MAQVGEGDVVAIESMKDILEVSLGDKQCTGTWCYKCVVT